MPRYLQENSGMVFYIILMCYLFKSVCGVKVETNTGVYEGNNSLTYSGVPYLSFQGIKYAYPVRFKPSIAVEDSSELYQATESGPPCIQSIINNGIIGEEDCLYLNVYTPAVKESLPVIVYIHEGAWQSGQANAGPQFYMETGRVIFVDIQYRLGVLGFVDFKSREYPSNLGLKDQVLALRWIQRNIEYFGGDPSRVTLQGESAGGASVHFHMLSPLSKGLFVGGISESGTGCNPWAVQLPNVARARLRALVVTAECPIRTVPFIRDHPADQAAHCLSQLPAHQLVQAVQRFAVPEAILPFRPVVEDPEDDEAFITYYPWEQPEVQVPWISGVNSNEAGSLKPLGLQAGDLEIGLMTIKLGLAGLFLPDALLYRDTSANPDYVTNLLLQFYNQGQTITMDNLQSFIAQAGSAGLFVYPNYLCHKFHLGSPSFNYVFDYVRHSLRDQPERMPGVHHSEELPFLFDDSDLNIRTDESQYDASISTTLVDLWISFAESTVPEAEGVEWEMWDPRSDRVLLIDDSGFTMTSNPNRANITFWAQLPIRNRIRFNSKIVYPL